MKIDETPEEDYEQVKIEQVGLIDPMTGAMILKSLDGAEFHITAFSAEVATHIANFIDQKREELPTIYNMFENMCEENEVLLVKVKIYETGGIFRATLYFTGRKEFLLRNYRASDAIALATFYNVPILVRRDLLHKPQTKTLEK
ncbi:bifunctional nuclease family protein [Candidatus Nitrosotenuis cloacae]|uniref:bifunctional nuclease family protein n=1 Tax=Candidatus Nitrosotenuis cloacae TaxID=1603555 RepID=UPI00228154A9|nr:bifunctional nuclease domain-containing protein [Candidatus Nitrosotenuis cloacae]